MFYTYNQNNSGGSFDYNPDKGISHYVIIEANSIDEANCIAENIGIYFNGVDDGSDCDCCGDRWHPYPSSHDEPTCFEHNVLTNTFEDVKNTKAYSFITKWIDGFEGFIHYKDGSVIGFWS